MKTYEQLCQIYKLGKLINSPQQLTGGVSHCVYRIETSQGHYIIKRLSRDVFCKDASVCSDEQLITHIHKTQSIAKKMAESGINAVTALIRKKDLGGRNANQSDSECLTFLEGEAHLVFPYLEVEPLSTQQLNAGELVAIAQLLAKIHAYSLRNSFLRSCVGMHINLSESSLLSNTDWQNLLAKSQQQNSPIAKLLKSALPKLLHWQDLYQQTLPELAEQQVISHGDLIPGNVLWLSENIPHIIDWECAGAINPTLELAALVQNWSGFLEDSADWRSKAELITEAYYQAGGIAKPMCSIWQASLGSWLEWLYLNAQRALTREGSAQQQAEQMVRDAWQSLSKVSELDARFLFHGILARTTSSTGY